MPQYDITSPTGDTYEVTAPAGSSPEDILTYVQQQTAPSMAGSFLRGAANAIPFGTKALAGMQSGDYDKNIAKQDALLSIDKATNPMSHYVGEATGTIAPLAIPGVGEVLGADSLAGRVAAGAGIGALQGASNTRAPLTSEEGMKDIGTGALVGGLTQPLVGAVGDSLSNITNKGMNRLEGSAAATSFGFTPRALMHEALATKQPEEQVALNLLGQLKSDPATSMAEHPDLWSVTSSINDKKAFLFDAEKEIGQKIGKIVEDQGALTTGPLGFPEGTQAIQQLKNSADTWLEHDPTTPEGAKLLKDTAAQLEALKTKGELNFKTIQNMKTGIGKNFNSGEVKPGTKEAYDILNGSLNDSLTNLENNLTNANPTINKNPLSSQFTQLKKSYTLLNKVIPMMKAAGREVTKPFSAFTKMLPIGLGAVTGNLGMGTVVAGSEAAKDILSPELASNIALKVAPGIRNLSSTKLPINNLTANIAAQNTTGPNLNSPQLAPWKPTFQNQTQGMPPADAQKHNILLDYVLQQRDPAYAKARADSSKIGNQ